MEKTKISVHDLNLYYGENHALKNVSMDIKEKAITAFIGPSGCGKSTFLKTLNRMNDLVDNVRIDGSVQIDGEDIYAKGIDTTMLRKKVGMVFQQPNPFPMSIYDNVAYGPRVHGIKDKKRLDQLVEESLRGAAIWDEVKDRLKKSALSLSGGQQQRICIARALAVEPDARTAQRVHEHRRLLLGISEFLGYIRRIVFRHHVDDITVLVKEKRAQTLCSAVKCKRQRRWHCNITPKICR